MAAFRRLLVIVCLLMSLGPGTLAAPGVQPIQADAPVGDTPLPDRAAPASVLGSPIKEDDTHFVVDTGGDLDQYLFRDDRADGKLKFEIPIKRYYFNTEDTNIRFDSSGFLTPAAVSYATNKKVLPSTVNLRMRVYDVDEDATWCPEVDLVFVNGKELKQNGQQARLSGANEAWSVVSYDVPISLLKFPRAKGNDSRPTPAENEITIRVDASNCIASSGHPAWAVEVDYGILEIPSPVRPVVFAHGWTGSTESFKTIEGRLKADGIPSGGHADLLEGIYPISDTAIWLSGHVSRVAREFGVDKVNLFAHSKGGLVARWYMQGTGVSELVETLITFDSPHHGTEWADNAILMSDVCLLKYPLDWAKAALCWEATKEFSTESVRNTFNYSGCTYNLFAGWRNCQPKYWRLPNANYRAFAAIGDPVVVPKSTTQYPWNGDKAPMPSWTWINVDAEYFTSHGGILDRQDSYQCAIHLLDSRRFSCPGVNASAAGEGQLEAAAEQPETAAAAERTASQVILTQSGNLAGAGLFTATAAVDGGSQLVLEVYSNAPLDFTLVEPGGRLINPGVASADPSIDYSDDPVFDMRHYAYLITNPIPGTWSAQAQSSGAAALTIVGLIDSPVIVSVLTDKTAYRPGDTITAQAALLQSGAAMPGGTLTGEFEQSSGSFVPVSFYDNGSNGDSTAGDGVFTARFTAPAVQANLYLNVGANRSVTHREESILIPVSAQTADIGGVTDEWTVDDDGDGLIDRLMIRLNIQVLRSGHFDLQGMLVDSHGNFVQAAQFGTRSLGSAPLNPGTYAVVLEFNGQQIWESGKEGQFTLTGLVLNDSSGQIFQVDTADRLYTTRAYARSQFERPALGFESGSATAIDQNGNNRYDVLTFRLRFSVLPTGSYNVNGRLADKNGDEIAWSSANFSASSSGVYPVELSFSGSDIGKHRVDGPYFLKDVSVYNEEGTAAAYFASLAETDAYRFTHFENGFYQLNLPMASRPGSDVWHSTAGLAGRIVYDIGAANSSCSTVFAAVSDGAYRSTDGGSSWHPLAVPGMSAAEAAAAPVFDGQASPDADLKPALAVCPTDANMIYVGGWGSGVHRSTDGGSTWQARNSDLSDPRIYDLAIDPSDCRVVYAASAETGVFKTVDGGNSWQARNSGLANPLIRSLAIAPGNPNRVYVGTSSGVYRSDNGAATWVATGALPAATVWTLAVPRDSADAIYAGVYGYGVYRSVGGGSTWQTQNSGLGNPKVRALAMDPLNTHTVYAGLEDGGGVYRSLNDAGVWTALNNGFSGQSVKTLWQDGGSCHRLLAGTTSGAWYYGP